MTLVTTSHTIGNSTDSTQLCAKCPPAALVVGSLQSYIPLAVSSVRTHECKQALLHSPPAELRLQKKRAQECLDGSAGLSHAYPFAVLSLTGLDVHVLSCAITQLRHQQSDQDDPIISCGYLQMSSIARC